MSDLEPIGISLPADLLESFDAHIARHGYDNRFEAFEDCSLNSH